MNTSMNENEKKIIIFFKDILKQLINYNSIEVDNLKLLCYTLYKEKNSSEKHLEIDNLCTIILSYINHNTKVYMTSFQNFENNMQNILSTYINNEIKKTLGD